MLAVRIMKRHDCAYDACCQDYEAETREQLRQPTHIIEAQIAAAQADWQFAQTGAVFDHKLVCIRHVLASMTMDHCMNTA